MVSLEKMGEWLGDYTRIAFSLPARAVDEELVNDWARDLEKMLYSRGIDEMHDVSQDLYMAEVGRNVEPDEAAYNMGLAGAAALEEMDEPPASTTWMTAVRQGARYGALEVGYDGHPSAKELTALGFRDYEKLADREKHDI